MYNWVGFSICFLSLLPGLMFLMCIGVMPCCSCLVGLKSAAPGSPMVMSAAQSVLLARSAARAERTETLKETKTLARRKVLFASFPLCVCLDGLFDCS